MLMILIMNFLVMINNFNIQLFTLINAGAGQYLFIDWLFILLTSYSMYTVFVVVGFYVVLYVPLRIPKGLLRTQSIKRSCEIVVSIVSTWVIVKILKIVIALPRPFETFEQIRVLAPIKGGTSFPSGHAALSMALATAVYLYYPRLGKVLFVFAFFVGLSRIFVGVHYPLDVAIGLALGYIVPNCIHTVFTFVKIAPIDKKA